MSMEFITTKYRVRPGVPTLIKFLEWKEILNNEDNYNKHILDTVIKEAIKIIVNENLIIKKDRYKKRKDRSLTFEKKTIQMINDKREDLKCYKGEFIEICLYIYAKKYLTIEEQKLNGVDHWDIQVSRNT